MEDRRDKYKLIKKLHEDELKSKIWEEFRDYSKDHCTGILKDGTFWLVHFIPVIFALLNPKFIEVVLFMLLASYVYTKEKLTDTCWDFFDRYKLPAIITQFVEPLEAEEIREASTPEETDRIIKFYEYCKHELELDYGLRLGGPMRKPKK